MPTVDLWVSEELDGASGRGLLSPSVVGVTNGASRGFLRGSLVVVIGGTLVLAPGSGNRKPVPLNIDVGDPNRGLGGRVVAVWTSSGRMGRGRCN